MGISVLLSIVSWALLPPVDWTYGQKELRSASEILERIYGPPVGTQFRANRSSERASSTQYPMVATIWELKYNDEEQEFAEEFVAGGVIISEWVVISACSYFFVSGSNNTLIRVEDHVKSKQNEKEQKIKHVNYLVRAGEFSISSLKLKGQSIPIRNMTAHPMCAKSLNTNRQLLYDAVAIQLVSPLLLHENVGRASFYSLNSELAEDMFEEMQAVNARCHLVFPTKEGALFSSQVQILSEKECNTLLCMVGAANGDVCRHMFHLYEMGVICTLSINGDVPCETHGGVLICKRQVFGFATTEYCKVCAPQIISKPMAMIYLAKKYSNNEEPDPTAELLREIT